MLNFMKYNEAIVITKSTLIFDTGLAKRPAKRLSLMAMVLQKLTVHMPTQQLKPPPHPRGSDVVYSPLPNSLHPSHSPHVSSTYICQWSLDILSMSHIKCL